jgi:hypothetical protein
MAVPVIVGIRRRRLFVRIRNGGRIREVGGLFMNLAQLRRKGLSKCSSCKKQRGLRCFVGVDSLRKMSVEFGIWQGWQEGQALRVTLKGRLFPSYPFR